MLDKQLNKVLVVKNTLFINTFISQNRFLINKLGHIRQNSALKYGGNPKLWVNRFANADYGQKACDSLPYMKPIVHFTK
ncbi:hypothetical protein VF02_09950 [Nostoc linckia z1]|nr:hypothetical protein VF02_09950 [Nostoc linckia z1]PHK21922.1 hypothetical protein VF11_07030 [Nostoc linckia z14]PHK39775.1 hypothetical protein VF12_13080 [Nostoc linckia z15]